MITKSSPLGENVVAAVAGFGAVVALVVVWHVLGLASPAHDAGYALSQYLSSCLGIGFAIAFLIVIGALGWAMRRPAATAAGTVAPLALALVIEVVRDPTSHNLFPFEIIIGWCPVFVVAFLAGMAGRAIRISRQASRSLT